MTMKLAKTFAILSVALAMSLCLASGSWAQAIPTAPAKPAKAPKPAHKAKTATPHHAAAAPSATPAPGTEKSVVVNKRDPFSPLVSDKKDNASALRLPPGKAGLVIATVRVDGAVHSPNGMIAMVSNPANSVYFIHEGDRLYDGSVEKIGLDGVTFRENSKDAFGKSVERVVTKRIYASAGEQQ
jgi:Tfp pilus assembly protein PilP